MTTKTRKIIGYPTTLATGSEYYATMPMGVRTADVTIRERRSGSAVSVLGLASFKAATRYLNSFNKRYCKAWS